MSTVLTDFVRQMPPGSQGPSLELFRQAWGAMRGLLAAEMKRRGSWRSPPSFLGVVGHAVWTHPEDGTDALDELTAQCFDWVFVKRIRSLRHQAQVHASVDGLVTLAVRQFLFEMQRRNDPLGFRIFEVLRRLVKRQVDAGRLRIVAGDDAIRNETLLARRDADAETLRQVEPAPLAELWMHRHLDRLVTASHKDLSELLDTLDDDLCRWLDDGPPGFRFGDLAAALKSSCRNAWAARFLDSTFVGGPRSADSMPEADVLRRFAALSRCVVTAVHTQQGRAKTRRYLKRLWHFLETIATRDGELPALTDNAPKLPSHRQLSKLLDIPRDRISGLLVTLGEQLDLCRRQPHPATAERTMTSHSPPPPQERTYAALRAALAQQTPDPTFDGWTVGDLVDLRPASVSGVYWLILGAEPGGRRWRCAPIDSHPLLGPADVAVPADDGAAAWVLRADFETSLDHRQLKASKRVARLAPDALETALAGPVDDGRQRVEASLPAYADWLEEGPQRAYRSAVDDTSSEPRSHLARPSASRPWAQLLAAALAAATIGLALFNDRLLRDVERLSEPILDLPYEEIRFTQLPRGKWTVEVPSDATHVRLGFVLSRQPDYPSYRLELLDADGRLVYRTEDLAPKDSYHITFPVDRLAHPPLAIRLFGIRGETVTLLDEEEVVVRSPAP